MRLRVSVHACLLDVLLPTHTAGTGRESPTITSVHEEGDEIESKCGSSCTIEISIMFYCPQNNVLAIAIMSTR